MRRISSMAGAAAVAGALALGGCSGTPRELPEPEPVVLPEEVPEDFTISVTVLGPAGTPAEVDATARPERPARYIVEPDGVLRAAIGPGVTPRVFPGETRRLDEAQRVRLWRLVSSTGLLEPDSRTRIDNTETFFPSRDRATALVYVKQRGEGSDHAVRLPVGDIESASVRRLIDELATLAWVPE